MALDGSADHPGLLGPGGSMTQGHQCSFRCQPRPKASVLPLVVSGVMDIDEDSGCNRATDLDITFGSSLDLDGIIVRGAQITQVGMTLGVACPLDTSMARGSSCPEAGHPCSLWWQLGPWTSTQTKIAVGPWIQT